MARTTLEERKAKLLEQLAALETNEQAKLKTRSEKLRDQIAAIDERIAKLQAKKDELVLELEELATTTATTTTFTSAPAEEV
jgi:predicted  nucleic acid-binding Zn-ribbon protein